MKRILRSIGAGVLAVCAAATAAIYLRNKKKEHFDTDSIDGGVVKRCDGADSPKTVSSTEITKFKCVFSLIAHGEDISLEHGVYTLSAALENGYVNGKFECSSRNGSSVRQEFSSSPQFMDGLYDVIAKYDFAQYNGYVHTVSGLPNMYGAQIDITFVSGESIYAHDNQSNFLPLDAMCELEALFKKQIEK